MSCFAVYIMILIPADIIIFEIRGMQKYFIFTYLYKYIYDNILVNINIFLCK
jgi:hypothetical protein